MRVRPESFKVRGLPSKPANYVLWQDGLDFYVSKRVGHKRDSYLREHFVRFFAHEDDAWEYARVRTLELIDMLNGYIKRFKKERRRAQTKR